MWYPCPVCGAPCLSKQDANNHCKHYAGSATCPNCNGSGKIVHILGPNETCPRCQGTGTIGLDKRYW